MPSARSLAKRALGVIRAPIRLANRHQWLTPALIVGGTITYLVLSALWVH